MEDFLKDLKKGIKAQEYIISQLKKEYKGLRQIDGNFKDYDLKANNGYTAEVKFDLLSEKTKRVGFEYECYGKKSGISNTKSYEWIHIYKLYDEWVYSRIHTTDLKSFLKSNWHSLKKVSGGDNNASKLVLVSVYDIADSFEYKAIV